MGKRSAFARVERDFYRTPAAAVVPLLPHLDEFSTFIEPCAGAGDLVDHLSAAGHSCLWAFDVAPQRDGIEVFNALDMQAITWAGVSIITNPPWARETLHRMIVHFSDMHPTWLLFDADWVHTRQATPYLPRLRKIVAVGRVKWIPNSKFTGKDNCAWHLFDKPSNQPAEFWGRA